MVAAPPPPQAALDNGVKEAIGHLAADAAARKRDANAHKTHAEAQAQEKASDGMQKKFASEALHRAVMERRDQKSGVKSRGVTTGPRHD